MHFKHIHKYHQQPEYKRLPYEVVLRRCGKAFYGTVHALSFYCNECYKKFTKRMQLNNGGGVNADV